MYIKQTRRVLGYLTRSDVEECPGELMSIYLPMVTCLLGVLGGRIQEMP